MYFNTRHQKDLSLWLKNYYDEDFKRTLVGFYHKGKTQAFLIKSMVFLKLLFPDESSNTPLVEYPIVKF